MNHRWPGTGATPGTALLLLVVLAGAAAAGMMTALVGSMAGTRAIYYAAVFGLIVVGALVAVTRREPMRFVFLALIAGFPVASAAVPPGRLEITVFDAVMTLLAIGLVWGRVAGAQPAKGPIFPTASLAIAWLLAGLCVVLSLFPVVSLKAFVLMFAAYAFFLLVLEELKRPGGFERLVSLFSVVLLVMAAGCLAERVLEVNLSLRGTNLNQLSYADAGFEIYRAGGFFQDPQKAAAWLASMIAFLLVLAVRGRIRDAKPRLLVWAAIVLGLGALLTTVSRAAIVACLCISVLALFAFNRWNATSKLAILVGAVLAAIGTALMPVDLWLGVLPASVLDRFLQSRVEFAYRVEIWFDTWRMFADQPFAGIGLGGFRQYLLATQPTVTNYYGLGEAAGIAYIPDQPESGYFKILYEGGIVGSLAALLVAADAPRRAIAVSAASADPDARSECIAALAGLAAFALTFVTLFTVGDPRMAGLLAFLLAVVWHRSLQRAQPAPKAAETGRWNRR